METKVSWETKTNGARFVVNGVEFSYRERRDGCMDCYLRFSYQVGVAMRAFASAYSRATAAAFLEAAARQLTGLDLVFDESVLPAEEATQ